MNIRVVVGQWLRKLAHTINRDQETPWNDNIAKVWLPVADELFSIIATQKPVGFAPFVEDDEIKTTKGGMLLGITGNIICYPSREECAENWPDYPVAKLYLAPQRDRDLEAMPTREDAEFLRTYGDGLEGVRGPVADAIRFRGIAAKIDAILASQEEKDGT